MGWEADFRINLRDTFHSSALGGPFQLASYSNPDIDALLDRLDTVRDRDEATPLWHRVQRTMRDEQPWTFLWYVPNLYAASASLRGAVMDVRGAFVNVGEWWLDGPAVDQENGLFSR
jgi:ABC-type transport system substrate-binding protein